MKSESISLGILIRRERKKRKITAEQLADRASISRSYISKIENGEDVDDFIYEKLFDCLNITYHSYEECSQLESKLSRIYLDILYLRTTKEEVSTVLQDLENYKYSFLFSRYMIISLMYFALFDKDESIEKTEFLVEIDKLSYLFTLEKQQIIFDYLGYAYMYKDLDKAGNYFKKAISLGVFSKSTSILYYHYGIYNYKINELCLALFYCMKSLDRLGLELNYKRMFYSQFHIANIFMLKGNYEESIDIYNSLMSSDMDVDKSIVLSNLSWALYKSNQFSLAKETINKCVHKAFMYYFHSILIDIALNNTNDAMEKMQEFRSTSKSEHEKNIINILENRIMKKYDENYKDDLIHVYRTSRKCNDIEVSSILNSFLVEYYKEKRAYKEVCSCLENLNKMW